MVQTKKLSSRAVKAFSAIIFAFVMCFTCLDCSSADAAASGFYVNGTAICDSNGNAFVMRGVNIAHAWYADKTEASIRGAADLGANTVRVVLSNGSQYSKTSSSEIQNIIDLCKSNDLVCILEVHDATGSDNTYDLDKCVDYWIEMKDVLSGTEKYVIVNIANEWYGSWNGSPWAEGNKSAIQKLRNAGISNMLMVDSAGWGQYPDSIKDYGRSVFNADPDKNTVFSIHMYEYAGGNSTAVKNNIDNALDIGVPVVIGEFGAQHTNGDVDEATIMSYCTQKNVGYLGWSWKGNSSELGYLDIANDWNGSSLTSWGSTLINGTDGIKSTSKICSVYTGSSSSEPSSGSSSDSSSSYVSLFYGSSRANNWGQAVSVSTTKNGGSFDASQIKTGGHFYVEYEGTQDQVELIFQSWSGAADWAKISISESGYANGHCYAKFSYDNCVSTFGTSDFSNKLDVIHVGATNCDVNVISVCYDYGTGSASSDSGAASVSGSSDSSSSASSPSSSESSSSASSESEQDSYTSLFWGSVRADAWGQAVSVMTAKNGGWFSGYDINPDGYFYIEYSGTEYSVELILQSWSGASSWAKVQPSETGTANGHYYAKYSYDNCVSAFGTSDFGEKLDQIHAGAANNGIEIYSLCYCW